MRDLWESCEYMRELKKCFYGEMSGNHEAEQIHQQLVEELSKEQRGLLLKLIDSKDRQCDEIALECFIEGFRLAAGISKELSETVYAIGCKRNEEMEKRISRMMT